MTNFTSKIAGLATLALAALPMAALPASALAAPATVKVADLNLASPEGMATFDKRAHNAAASYCGQVRGLTERQMCREAVREELAEKAAAIRTAQIARQTTFAAR